MEQNEMTVFQAQEEYSKNGINSVNHSYRHLIDDILEQDVRIELSNDSYLDALFLSQIMLNRTRGDFRMICGVSTGRFFEVLEEPITKCLNTLKKNGGDFRIIAEASEVPSIFNKLKSQFGEVFKFKLTGNHGLSHCMVSDHKMVRIEEPHPPLTAETLASEIKAKVYFDEPDLANLYNRSFDNLWSK